MKSNNDPKQENLLNDAVSVKLKKGLVAFMLFFQGDLSDLLNI